MILEVRVKENGVTVIPLPIRSKFNTQDFFVFMPDVNPKCFIFFPIIDTLNEKGIKENLNDFVTTLERIENKDMDNEIKERIREREMEEIIDTFFGYPVSIRDKCIVCNKNFTKEDKGNISCYKPWINGEFWHLSCVIEKEKAKEKVD